MKNFIKLALVLLLSSTMAFAQKKPKDKVLDKKVYTVTLSEMGKKKPKEQPDEIAFTGQKLKSTVLSKEGYQPAAYEVEVDSSGSEVVITFTSEVKVSDNEVFKYEGTITGETIDGKSTLTKKEAVKKEYTFTGTLKQKGAKK